MNKEKYDIVKRNKQINQDRLGETRMINCGEIAFIVEYNNSEDITVQFKNSGELAKSHYYAFKNGNIKSRFTPSVYGVGITGSEKTRDYNGEKINSYICWTSMLQRCYSKKYQEKNPTYKDCTVCKEWIYYSNFKKWYDENYYEIDEEKSSLDKDWLFKNNKIYSPNTCVFVNKTINSLITKTNSKRGESLIGVSFDKNSGKYISNCRNGSGKNERLGSFTSSEDAFESYKIRKEQVIKEIAEKYKNKIPKYLYEAMLNYTVSITD